MPTTLEYMKLALNVYFASDENLIGVPFGWDRGTSWQPDLPSGFSAGAFVKGVARHPIHTPFASYHLRSDSLLGRFSFRAHRQMA